MKVAYITNGDAYTTNGGAYTTNGGAYTTNGGLRVGTTNGGCVYYEWGCL